MSNTTTKNEARAEECATIIEAAIGGLDETTFAKIQAIILTNLQAAYRDGFEKAYAKVSYPEDMGR